MPPEFSPRKPCVGLGKVPKTHRDFSVGELGYGELGPSGPSSSPSSATNALWRGMASWSVCSGDMTTRYTVRTGEQQVLGRSDGPMPKTVSREQCTITIGNDGFGTVTSIGRGPTGVRENYVTPWAWLHKDQRNVIADGTMISLDAKNPDGHVFTCHCQVAPPLAPTGGPLAALDDDANLDDLDTDAPSKLPSKPSHDGGVECGLAVARSSSSKTTLGSSWAEPLEIDSDDEAVGSSFSTPWASGSSLAPDPWLEAEPNRRIRQICLMIRPEMTPQGFEILVFCQETVLKDCPKARSGGAALAAACALQVPQETFVVWMREAEKLFASEVPIAWLSATRPETFRKWLDVARRRSPTALALVPVDEAGDAQLAAEMCRVEHFLLGMQSTSTALPNAAAMELVRWLLLDKPRPQMAFCFLKLKAIFEEGGDSLDGMMPPSWASQWESRAAKVTNHSFWWFGQGGEMPSAGDLVREQTAAAERYAHAARERLCCAQADRRPTCRGPLGHWSHICKACRALPEARLRDHCPWATAGCLVSDRCSLCTGEDGRKNRPIEARDRTGRARHSEQKPCPGGCIGPYTKKPRSNVACLRGFANQKGAVAQLAWCEYRFTKQTSPTAGQKRAREGTDA